MISKLILYIQDKILDWKCLYYNYNETMSEMKMKLKYPDYNPRYDYGSYHFIYGVTSWDNLTGSDANIHTMNDFEIGYDRETELYSLSIETAYMFSGDRTKGECQYLKELLDIFTKYMNDNNLDKTVKPFLCMVQPTIKNKAKSIEELYCNFKMFVLGYCAVCEEESE